MWNQTFTDGDPREIAMFHSFFPHVLEIVQPDNTRRDSSAHGIIRTMSRIDRIFISLPMAEALCVHCYSHVFENLTSCHSKTDTSRTPKQTYSSWMDVQTSHFLLPSATASRRPQVPLLIRFVRFAEFEVLLNKAEKLTIRELSRKTPDSIGAKLLAASAALRAYRNRHLGTLMRCCEAWKPIEDCFDTSSFECVEFQRLSQIIANLTRETLAEPRLRSRISLGRRQKNTLL